MKKLFTLIIAIFLCINVKAQTSLTEAVNFTVTECYGEEEITLFDILDRGQYVLIDFFFMNCTPCQTVAPKVAEAYRALGCNQHDVFFMEISPVDNDDVCQWWAERYGVEYPTVGKDGGGLEVDEIYDIHSYPTFVLIAPDRSIAFQDIDIYPIPDAQTIIDYLAPFGIEEHSCDEAPEINPSVEITLDEVTTTSLKATFTPNADCAKYHILADTQSNMEMWMSMMGASLEDLIVMWGAEKTSTATYTWDEMAPNTEYTIYALPKDADGNAGELVTTTVTTEQAGGTGTSVIELVVEVMTKTSVKTTATPNEETAVYHYGLIEKSYFDEIGEEAAVQIFREDPYPFYEVDVWEWIDLTPETDYYAIATGQNSEGEWGETTIVPFRTEVEGCDEFVKTNFSVYPNPASSTVNIISDAMGTARIFDMTSRCVMEVEINDLNTTINVETLNKGVYFINVNESVKKLVVK
ncbi:MAG: T9SS type A sorting domain-containing protein [Bacteroidales bacterium]|nr:T9SS type A sorting domain-containing protein [Bacteroidales bacterium]